MSWQQMQIIERVNNPLGLDIFSLGINLANEGSVHDMMSNFVGLTQFRVFVSDNHPSERENEILKTVDGCLSIEEEDRLTEELPLLLQMLFLLRQFLHLGSVFELFGN